MTEPAHGTKGWFKSRSGLVLLAFLALAGSFPVMEHTAHVLGILPYLLLLACPLIHLLHGGHGGATLVSCLGAGPIQSGVSGRALHLDVIDAPSVETCTATVSPLRRRPAVPLPDRAGGIGSRRAAVRSG